MPHQYYSGNIGWLTDVLVHLLTPHVPPPTLQATCDCAQHSPSCWLPEAHTCHVPRQTLQPTCGVVHRHGKPLPTKTHPAAGCQKRTSVCMGATLAPGHAAPARLGLSRRSSGTLAVRRLMTASGADMRPSRCCSVGRGGGGEDMEGGGG
jgi:hypothetical protein